MLRQLVRRAAREGGRRWYASGGTPPPAEQGRPFGREGLSWRDALLLSTGGRRWYASGGTPPPAEQGRSFGREGLSWRDALLLSTGLLVGTSAHIHSETQAPFDEHFIARPAAIVSPAVVNITTSSAVGRAAMGGGSGFVIDGEEGLILTNAHVVRREERGGRGGGHGDARLKVTLQDGRSFKGTVLNSDRLSDLAIVKLEGCDERLPQAKFGDSTKVRQGEWVLALGSPLLLQNTVTAGIVSCVERKRTELGIPGSRTDYIQTDAAINVGNSGGPLVNLRGEVIGINTIKAAAADSIAFAIPVETAKFVVSQIRRHGRVVRPYIGIKMLDLTEETARMMRDRDRSFPKDLHEGVYVPQVTPGSPAEAAGFRPGDVIVSFGGEEVRRGSEIIQLLGTDVGRRHQAVVVREHGRRVALYVESEENVS